MVQQQQQLDQTPLSQQGKWASHRLWVASRVRSVVDGGWLLANGKVGCWAFENRLVLVLRRTAARSVCAHRGRVWAARPVGGWACACVCCGRV